MLITDQPPKQIGSATKLAVGEGQFNELERNDEVTLSISHDWQYARWEFKTSNKYHKKLSRKLGQSPVTGKKALGGWRHENPFLSLDAIQEGLDHERVLEKKFDL